MSVHPAGQASVDETTEFIGGKKLSSVIGASYPLLIKLIQANEILSVQVHPDDDYARIHENSAGKTECWYILDAEPGASLIYGLNGEYSREELRHAIENNSLDSYLQSVPVTKGDFVFIPAGTVHAIKGGPRLLEIQESSDITYRLYDWGRAREVHVEKGLDVIKPECNKRVFSFAPFAGRFTCPYFTLEKISAETFETLKKAPSEKLEAGTYWDFQIASFSTRENAVEFAKELTREQASAFDTPAAKSGWACLVILSGSGTLESNGGESFKVQAEDCILLRTEEKITVTPDSHSALSIMEIG